MTENTSPESHESENVDTLIEQLNNATRFTTPTKPVVENDTHTEEIPDPKETVDVEPPPIDPLKATSMAQRWTKTFSSGMRLFFSWLYRKTILKPGDEKAMADFVRVHKGQSEKEMAEAITSDSPLYDVSNRFEKYMKACESIPLDQDEIDSIAEPLQELIIKYKNLQLGPEWMLVIAVGIVTLPRIAPMIDMSTLFATKK